VVLAVRPGSPDQLVPNHSLDAMRDRAGELRGPGLRGL